MYVSAALFLATFLLWRAGTQLAARGQWELQLTLAAAAMVAFVFAVLPWVASTFSPESQRAGLWKALTLAVIPAATTVHAIDFSAIGACQLLLTAGVLAELGARRRILAWLWATTASAFIVTLLHVARPLV